MSHTFNKCPQRAAEVRSRDWADEVDYDGDEDDIDWDDVEDDHGH